ncbi:hypothetical protein MPTK1_5g23880 [Marchantia polymorpha subsp. ruderalis]|nr:hypothetical protein MARPO_0010s0068 [Marchantia polymorpha]BBN12906.1 hypothetical protein Mp_5g23880 [Marchantia polymorpha subsp. ruderalis]|eukprot:PTQ46667.1 hypothetical protein MARPO_0010s0068 [Marchantia polymorpha]
MHAAASLQKNTPFRKAQSLAIATRKGAPNTSHWDHRTRILTRITASGNEDQEENVKENVTRRSTLQQLDEQLTTLSERDDAPASRPSLGPSTQQVRPVKRKPGEEGDGALEWPEFSPGFLGFLGLALLVLTVFNNLLYRTFLGPPVVPFRTGDPVLSSAGEGRRYRISSLSEARDAKEAEEAAAKLAAGLQAPSLSSD